MDENAINTAAEETATEQQTQQEQGGTQQDDLAAEVARLKAENQRQKAALDKTASEAAGLKRQLRAKQSAEEQQAEEKREQQEALENELKQLRRQSATANIAKRVMGFLGDEEAAGSIADALYGAEDVDAAIDLIAKTWSAKEKALRLEYSKLPAPAAGDGAPTMTREDIQKMSYKDRAAFAEKYPETYQKLIM